MEKSYFKDLYNYLSEKHPNSKVYVISDHHFYHHNIINYERQQFSDVNEMNKYIIDAHNHTVNNTDIVIFLGDFSFKKSRINEILTKMNGHKYLIMGNHDSNELLNSYEKYGFEGVYSVPIKLQNSYLSHQQLNDEENNNIQYRLLLKEFNADLLGVNYYGHKHHDKNSDVHYKNITCESLNYKPLLIGKTGNNTSKELPYFINSPLFSEYLEKVKSEKNLPYKLLVSDYIYTTMLELNNRYLDNCCICGSYTQYKKYGYISDIDDLDVSIKYNEKIGKTRNTQILKDIADNIYSGLNKIEGINPQFQKRFNNLCIFSYLFTNKYIPVTHGALDANMIPLDFYKDSDFVKYDGISTIEKKTYKDCPELRTMYKFPKFEANFLTKDGDIANLVLQLMFQKGHEEKQESVLKKINYISKYFQNNDLIDDNEYENMFTRFLFRNIVLLYTLGRKSEIDYIKNVDVKNSIEKLPNSVKERISEIVLNSNSDFYQVFEELKNIPNNEIVEKSNSFVRQLKEE